MRSSNTTPSARRGFTLLELLLTLAIIAMLASIAIPGAGLLLGDRELVRAGDQVRIEMTRLRIDAMRQGRVMMLEGMAEGNTLRIRPYYSAADANEAVDQTGSQNALLTGADQGTAVPIQVDQEAEKTIELSEGLSIELVAVASAARSMEIVQMTEGQRGQGWSQPILFYPDGTTSTAMVVIADPTLGRVQVKLRGVTGDVTVSEVLP